MFYFRAINAVIYVINMLYSLDFPINTVTMPTELVATHRRSRGRANRVQLIKGRRGASFGGLDQLLFIINSIHMHIPLVFNETS